MHKKIIVLIFLLMACAFCFLKAKGDEESKKETFSFWTIQLKAPLRDLINQNIREFENKHPDIKVVWVDMPINEIQKRTIASILGGSPPDLINLNPEFSLSLAKKNTLEFLDDKDAVDYDKNLVDKLRYQGKIYALPFYATSSITILNKEKFKNCNVKLNTYSDILKLTSCKNPPVYGISLNEGETFSKILNKYNTIDSDKVYFLFDEMKNKNLLLKDTLTINHREAVEKYMAGSAGFISAGSNFINIIKQNAPNIYKNSEILPQLKGDIDGYDVSLMNLVIPSQAKNKELALEFSKQLLTYENQMALSKKTNVIPVNKKVLADPYFTNCSNEPMDKARCIASNQVKKPILKEFNVENKRELTENINRALETLFIKGKEEYKKINIQASLL